MSRSLPPFLAAWILESTVPLSAFAQVVSFVARMDYASGPNPQSVAAADLDADGRLDLVVANYDAHTVSVLLGQGEGFQAALTHAVGTNPQSVAVGDLNGDGRLDLAVANAGSHDVSLLLGNGNGTFGAASNLAAGASPRSVAVGDLNQDGRLDLAVANYGSHNVAVLLGAGAASFEAPASVEVGNSPQFVAAADCNGDGRADLVVANAGSNSVSVLLGRGDGTFPPAVSLSVGVSPSSVAARDLDGDGRLDLAVTNYGSHNVSVLRGNGDGTFQPAQSFLAGAGPWSVAPADFNGDGRLDLAVAAVGSRAVSVLVGRSDGTFQAPLAFAMGSFPLSVAAGDFDADGTLDLAVATGASLTVSLLRGNGDGTFRAAPTVGVGVNPQWVAVGDFNGDSRRDLAVANAGFSTVDLTVLTGNGDGTFLAGRTFGAGGRPTSVAVGEFNGDGIQDLAVANYDANTVSVVLGNGDGTFRVPRSFAVGATPNAVVVEDFNRDGRQDLAAPNYGNGTADANTVSVLLGNGDGTFAAALTYVADRGPANLAVGDFNGDARPDLATANYAANTVSVLVGNGDGTFQAPRTFLAGGSGPWAVTTGELNGDGRQDLAVANYLSHDLSVLLGNGDGTLRAPVTLAVDRGPGSIHAVDLNGDGIRDLATANYGSTINGTHYGSTTVSVLQGNGDGTFQPARSLGAGSRAIFAAVADLNNDGRPDLAVANYGLDNVSVLTNDTPRQGFTLTVAKAGTGAGTVTSSPAGISCGATCAAAYAGGTVVTLTAAAAGGSTFTGWSGGGCSGTGSCAVTVSAATTVTASFATSGIATPVLKWQYGGCVPGPWCGSGWYSSPAVADLEADGQPDVIWGSYDVVALNGANGSLKWRGASDHRVWPGVAVADLTGDGPPEVIVGRASNQLTVYSRTGGVVWTRNPFSAGSEVRTLAVADLETDGQLEIVVGNTGDGTFQVNAYQPNGTVRPGWPARHAGEPGFGSGLWNENVAVADLNGDGLKEIFAPASSHYITALARNGSQLPANSMYNNSTPTGPKAWSQVGVHVDHAVDLRGFANCGAEHRPDFSESAPVVADLDGNGVRELIVVGSVYNCGTDPYADLYHMPFILKLDRSRWSGGGFDWTVLPTPRPGSAPRSVDYEVIEKAVPNPAVADLDGDGLPEIVYPSYDGRVHAYWLDKTEHGSWPYTVPSPGGADNFRFASEVAVADLNGDGRAEVLFTSWPQKATGGTGHLHIVSDQGVELSRVPLPPPALDGTWNGGLGAPTIANIDGDPDLELVMGTATSGVVAYDLPGSAGARILWGTGRGGYRRAGTTSP